MSTHYIVPTFNQSIPNKVDNKLIVTGQNTVARQDNLFLSFFSAIASESIPSTVDGEYIFAVRIEDIGNHGAISIGVTVAETSDKNVRRRHQDITSSTLYLINGNYMPGNSANLIDDKIANKAHEVIVIVTISPGRFYGHYCSIRWIVDGTSSKNRDCTSDCKGDKLFPLVILGEQVSQITTIPIDEITIRNDEVNKLIEKFSKQASSSQGAVAVGNNDEPHPSSAAFAQLHQELEQERKRADLAETQLHKKDQELQQAATKLQQEKQSSNAKDQQLQHQSSEINQLKQQLLTLQSQLNNRY